MRNIPKVSVITVTYNLVALKREWAFLQCLRSVHTQKYGNFEHIIVDGGSTDGTADILKAYAEKGWITYISEPDTGIYEAMNKGSQLAKGAYVTFLNSDDIYSTPHALAMSVKALETTHADFSYAPVQVINRDGTHPSTRHYQESPIITDVFWHMPFSHQTMFMSKAVLKKIGMYDTQFKYAGDYDLILRLCLKNYKSVFINEKFVTYRKGGKSDMNSAACTKEVYAAFLKNYSPLVDISPEDCRRMYTYGLAAIPYNLAEKLKNIPAYFDSSRYGKENNDRFIEVLEVTEKTSQELLRKVNRKLHHTLETATEKMKQVVTSNMFGKKVTDMMEVWHNEHIDAALAFVGKKNPKILVIGCNRGEECAIFYKKNVRDISGIDLIDELGEKFPNKSVKYYSGSAENMHLFDDNTYDLVYSFATFEHIHDIENAYKEAVRVIKPGGIVYIFASPLWNSPYGHHYENTYTGYPWVHLQYDEEELLDFCQKNRIKTTKEQISYMLASREFNRRSSDDYTNACSNIPGIEIIKNQLAQVDRGMEKQIPSAVLKKGYEVEDLLSIWHLFVAKKKIT